MLEGSEGIQFVVLEGESDQDGDHLVASSSDDSVLDEFSQGEHISRVGERFIEQASLFRGQDLGGGGEGIFSNLKLLVGVGGLVDASNQVFEVSLVPLVLVGEDEGEFFRGNIFSLTRSESGQQIGGLLLGISVVEAVEDDGLEDSKTANSVAFESVGGNESDDLVAIESMEVLRRVSLLSVKLAPFILVSKSWYLSSLMV